MWLWLLLLCLFLVSQVSFLAYHDGDLGHAEELAAKVLLVDRVVDFLGVGDVDEGAYFAGAQPHLIFRQLAHLGHLRSGPIMHVVIHLLCQIER